MERYEGATIEINSVEVLDEGDSTAEVRTSVTVDTGDRTVSDTATYDLRTADGEWKIYDIQP